MKNIDIDEEPLFIQCECGTETFEIRRSIYIDENIEDKKFYLTFWFRGRVNHPLRWKEKLRWCWQILRRGDPWSDGIVATDENAKKISEYINKHLNK